MQFETFDSSKEEKNVEKFIYKYIQRQQFQELDNLLRATRDKVEITTIYDKSGYTPIHYAAYKNIEKAVEIIIRFILSEDDDKTHAFVNGGSGETDGVHINETSLRTKKEERKVKLKGWINSISLGDDGFTALHFASFHGNMQMIKLLVKHGANIHAQNKQGINMLHVAAQGDAPVSMGYFL